MKLRKYSHYKRAAIIEIIKREVEEKGSSLGWWGTPDWEANSKNGLVAALKKIGIIETFDELGWVKKESSL